MTTHVKEACCGARKYGIIGRKRQEKTRIQEISFFSGARKRSDCDETIWKMAGLVQFVRPAAGNPGLWQRQRFKTGAGGPGQGGAGRGESGGRQDPRCVFFGHRQHQACCRMDCRGYKARISSSSSPTSPTRMPIWTTTIKAAA